MRLRHPRLVVFGIAAIVPAVVGIQQMNAYDTERAGLNAVNDQLAEYQDKVGAVVRKRPQFDEQVARLREQRRMLGAVMPRPPIRQRHSRRSRRWPRMPG